MSKDTIKDAEIAMLKSFLISELNNRPILADLERNNAKIIGAAFGFVWGVALTYLYVVL